MITLTIDQKSIESIASSQLDISSIPEGLSLPKSSAKAKCIQVGEHGYVLSRSFQPSDGLLVISLESTGPLNSLPFECRVEALGRILRCASIYFTGKSRSIPVSWRPYHFGNRISFHADRRNRDNRSSKTKAGRVLIDINNKGDAHRLFAFTLDSSGRQDIGAIAPNQQIFEDSLAKLPEAHHTPEIEQVPEKLGTNIALPSLQNRRNDIRLEEWYNSMLTMEQRSFVDHSFNSSVRLIGPAGCGKTLTLVVKCLRELQSQPTMRFLFLTHATSTASAIEDLVFSLLPEDGLNYLVSDTPRLKITTLYSLANDYMRYNLDELAPISLDGHEGIMFQADALNIVIEDFRKSDWIAFKSRCSAPFISYMEHADNSNERRFFLWEILNEFSCVLDAEGVRSSAERRTKYLRDTRKRWMLNLSTQSEREVLLALYDKFRAFLISISGMGTSQMIVDFLNYMDSYRWEATRSREGFDAIFVDELHLFNRSERLTFQHLMRDPKLAPRVFMAYDPKQSPRDTFLSLPGSVDGTQYDLWKDAKLDKADKIEILEIFRYTPQIVRALQLIDESFPGQDLDSDWPPYRGISKIGDGPIPVACELDSLNEVYSFVFERGRSLQKDLGNSGRVAILCASNDTFIRYRQFNELRELYIPVDSRDNAFGKALGYKRFTFSMPEYVAGLQFHTVLLIDVNRGETPDGPYSSSEIRKFVSQVYLGASRAEFRLEIYSSIERGGISPVITQAILNGAIIKMSRAEISK